MAQDVDLLLQQVGAGTYYELKPNQPMPLSLTTLPAPSYITPLLVVRRGPASTKRTAAQSTSLYRRTFCALAILPAQPRSSLTAEAVNVPAKASSAHSKLSMPYKALLSPRLVHLCWKNTIIAAVRESAVITCSACRQTRGWQEVLIKPMAPCTASILLAIS